jgi:hypothetical protein
MCPRYRFLASLIACLLFFAAGRPAAWADDSSLWQVGTARVRITPPTPMWMAGYAARDHAAEGTLTDLWAKALVLEDARGHRGVLVTLDLIGVSREFCRSVCRELKASHGLQRQQIAFCASHTHSGPALQRNLSPLHYLIVDPQQQRLIEQYTADLEPKIVRLVQTALQNMSAGRVAWGSGRATFAVNRRNNRADDVVPQVRDEGGLQGPFDHDVPVLTVHLADGLPVAIVFGYACHATVLSSYEWSGDYPGFAQIELEKSHPGCQAMFWAGCGADQNPLPRRSVELAIEYGQHLAAAVERVLAEPLHDVPATLQTSFCEIDLPLADLPTEQQLRQDTLSSNRYVAARARMLLASLEQGQPLSPTYPYPVQVWQLGDQVQFITLGGEVVVDFALRLKSELDGPATWVAGYANDVMAYIASRRVLQEGGYEGGGAMVYYGLPSSWAPESEDMIVREVHRQLGTQPDASESSTVPKKVAAP